MARSSGPDTDFDPRHRIVGAIILVTFAVIVLPLILDQQPGTTTATAAVPGADSPSLPVAGDTSSGESSRVVIRKLTDSKPSAGDKPAETKVVVKKLGDSKPTEVAKAAEPVKEKPAPEPVAAPVVKKVDPPTKVASTKAITTPHWAVQVGTFSNPGNVRRLSEQLKERGYSLMLKDIKLKQGTAVRVRVGPYSTRASADRAQGKIRDQIGVKGVVVAGP